MIRKITADHLDMNAPFGFSSGFLAFTNVGYVKYILTIVLTLILIKPTFAENVSGWWDKHEKEYSKLAKLKDCDGIWNLFWPEAKREIWKQDSDSSPMYIFQCTMTE